MWIYFFNFISILAYGVIIKDKKRVCILSSIQMFLILALRANQMGVDWSTYYTYYEYWKGLSLETIIKGFRLVGGADIPWGHESGYVLFNWILGNLGFSFHSFLVICAAVCMASMGRFIYKNSDNPILSFIIFVTLGGFELFFGIMRQSLGLAIFLFAVPAIKEKRFMKYMLLVVSAALFHSIYFLTIPLYFISDIKVGKKHIVVTILSSIIMIGIIPILFPKVIGPFLALLRKNYILGTFQWNNLYLLMMLLMVFILFFYKEKIFKTNYVFGWGVLIGLLLQATCFYISIFSRAVLGIFFPFLYVLLANTVENINQKGTRNIVKGIMYVAMFLVYIFFLQGSYYVPYISVFE